MRVTFIHIMKYEYELYLIVDEIIPKNIIINKDIDRVSLWQQQNRSNH